MNNGLLASTGRAGEGLVTIEKSVCLEGAKGGLFTVNNYRCLRVNFLKEIKGGLKMVMEKFFMDLKKRVDQRCLEEQAMRQSFHMAKTLTDKERKSEEYLKYLLDRIPTVGTKQ